MSKTVEPHNDYFSAQFLLTFTVAGIHQIYVDTALLDTDDTLWNAGPKAQLSVEIYEESGSSSLFRKNSFSKAKCGGRGFYHIYLNIFPKMCDRGLAPDVEKISVNNPAEWLRSTRLNFK